ncbi:hypothetical protein THTE_0261 [Thermogutta terrifontis]|uniref:Uncharacterized protein n=1 Tax=Thermogutta terrifontis TaxID=1331910 RepID=A0A286RA97_9BACT|nr:hypothetical protein THTE_0261 [Thermogutta terrifontis]
MGGGGIRLVNTYGIAHCDLQKGGRVISDERVRPVEKDHGR